MLTERLMTRNAISGDSARPSPGGVVTGAPALILRLEGAAVFLMAVVAYRHVDGPWLLAAILFLAPDLSMLFYLGGPRVGAAAYNLAHTYCGPAILAFAGLVHGLPVGGGTGIQLAAIWAAHIGVDRMLGFGLKYGSAFSDTHLGRPMRAARRRAE